MRKAAKRARYAAESAALTLGRPADTLATRMEDLQKLLGEVQDGVETRAILQQIAITAHLAGQDNFTFGLLFAEQRGDADAVMAGYPRVLRRAVRATV